MRVGREYYRGAETAAYEGVHGDIFNPIEQERLRSTLAEAVSLVQTGASPLAALDYGSGSGNLTGHLIAMGLDTLSVDVSAGFLDLVAKRFGRTGLSHTRRVNGQDLADLPSATFDLVATYSVLHHVPDYLRIVRELARVVKPRGIIYIDHEVTETYWQRPPVYREFVRRVGGRRLWRRVLRVLLDVRGYPHCLRRIANPRYKREGDIHVWPDDHIEWDRIEDLLGREGLDIVLKKDYLLFRDGYKTDVYDEYRDRCADERVLAARKR